MIVLAAIDLFNIFYFIIDISILVINKSILSH